MKRQAVRMLGAITFAVALLQGCAQPTPPAAAATQAKTEVLWLGQSGFRITTPGGKVIEADPWLRE